MKTLILLAALFPLFAHATDRCTIVSPKWPDLVDGVNADAICTETIYAVRGAYGEVPAGESLTISVGNRDTYHLMLWIVWTAPYSSGNYQGHGILTWNPDGTYVDLLDKPHR
jgi:hypothetical protein